MPWQAWVEATKSKAGPVFVHLPSSGRVQIARKSVRLNVLAIFFMCASLSTGEGTQTEIGPSCPRSDFHKFCKVPFQLFVPGAMLLAPLLSSGHAAAECAVEVAPVCKQVVCPCAAALSVTRLWLANVYIDTDGLQDG